ncbi:MAG TPA: hypothetical protein VK249_10570, partial [Anaerolineales bacterium]|nr:hypothetical protein [Anaerolineales bacterium]
MKLSMPGGRKVARNIISLALIVLPLWNFAGDPVPVANQQEQATATASPDSTEIVQPSETSSLPGAETLTPTLETPTEILPAYTATEASTAEEPISDQSLSGEFAPGEVLVRFRGRASREDRTRCIQSIHASIASEIGELNTLVLSVPAGKVAESIHHLQACPDLRYVEPNYLVRIADVIPTDPAWGNQYGLINIRAPQGWQLDTGSASVTIAIVDTGIDLGHADLAGKLVDGIDIVNGDNNPQDDNG